jgi:SPP1 gp7 family putative phage head morphogenesis protein
MKVRQRRKTFRERFRAAGREFFAATPTTKAPTIPSRSIHEYREYDYNPDPLLYEKGKGLELFDRMLMDDVIAGTMDLKKRLTLSANWQIQEASQDARDLETRDFVAENLESLEYPMDEKRDPARPSFISTLDNLLDARSYGFKLAVPHVVGDAGRWIYRSIICKPSYEIQFYVDQESDELLYIYVGEPEQGASLDKNERIDPSSVILFVWPYVRDANWYGRSDLSAIYREFFAKAHHFKFRNIHGQKFGSPTVVAEFRSDLSEDQITALKSSLDNWQDDLVIYIPADWHQEREEYLPQAKVSFLEQKQNGQAQYTETIKAIDNSMRRKLLTPDMAGFTDTKYGSRALGESQFANVMTLDTRYTRNQLCNVVNAQIIWPLVRWNFGPDAACPKLVAAGDGEGYTQAKAEAIKVGQECGLVSTSEKWVRPWAGIPDSEEIPEEEPTPTPAPEEPKPQADGDEKPGMQKMARSSRFNAKQARRWYDQIEGAADPIAEQALAETARAASEQAQKNGAMEGDWAKINDIKAPGKWVRQLRRAYEVSGSRMYFHGRLAASQELGGARRMRDVEQIGWPEWEETEQFLDRSWVESWLKEHGLEFTAADREAILYCRKYSFYMSGVKSQETVAKVGTLIFNNAKTMTTREMVDLIEADIAGKAKVTAQTIVRNNSSEMFNNGRMQTFREAGDIVQGYMYDAILDGRETPFCHEQDGRYIEARNPMFSRIIPPNHDNCRSVLSPVLKGETPPAEKWLQGTVPSKRFGGKR